LSFSRPFILTSLHLPYFTPFFKIRILGEIAMGLLFATCFVAAAAGWFVVWRNHQGKPVFGLGGGGNRYS
jgi:hypothetical protein